jgi:hypothetical protein
LYRRFFTCRFVKRRIDEQPAFCTLQYILYYNPFTKKTFKHALVQNRVSYMYMNIQKDNILLLLQDLYMFLVPAVPINRSTILQLTVTGITHIYVGS